MKQLKTIMLGLALISIAAPALALGPLDVSAELALNSKYVGRGRIATPDAVLQPEIAASVAGFGFGVWGNMDLTDVNGYKTDFNEIDYTLSYGLSLPLVSFGAGFIYYSYPKGSSLETKELYITASASVLLSPSLTIYQDLDKYKGAYWEASVSHGVPLSPMANLDFSAGLGLGSKGYLMGYYGVLPDPEAIGGVSDFTGASMSDFHISVGLPYKAIPFFTITPSVTYSTLMGDAKTAAEGADGSGDADAVFYGISASFSF